MMLIMIKIETVTLNINILGFFSTFVKTILGVLKNCYLLSHFEKKCNLQILVNI